MADFPDDGWTRDPETRYLTVGGVRIQVLVGYFGYQPDYDLGGYRFPVMGFRRSGELRVDTPTEFRRRMKG